MNFIFKDSLIFFILSFSLIIRILFLLFFPELDFPDARAYETMGGQIFAGELITNNIYMPLYPILSYISGGGVTKNILDIILSVAMVWVIYKLSYELFNSRASSMIAAIISSVYPHFVFYSISGLTETFFTLLLLISFLLFYKEKYLSAIFILILLVLIKPTLDLLNIFLVIGFTFFVFRRGYLSTIKHCLLYFLLYVFLMSPWWVHQYNKYGEFVRLNLGDGIVLYSGNNSLNQTGGGIGRHDGQSDMDLSKFSKFDNPIERNTAMKDAAISYIISNPGRFLELSYIKFVRFWRLWPHTELYQQWYTVSASLFSYGLVLFLAIGFAVRDSKKYFRKLIPIYALVTYLTLVHMITIGSIRYRFPLEPFLIIFASQFLFTLLQNKPWFINISNKYLE
jgi:hypothetical protein